MEDQQQVEKVIELGDQQEVLGVCGHRDENIRSLSNALGAKIVARGNVLKVIGKLFLQEKKTYHLRFLMIKTVISFVFKQQSSQYSMIIMN